MIRQQKGFSILEALVAAGLLGIVAMLAASLVSSQNASVRYLAQKADTIDIKLQMNHVFSNPDNCACQLNPDLTVDNSNDAALEFNSNFNPSDPPKSMNVRRVRVGCALTSPLIAEENQQLSPDIRIARVEFGDIRPTGNPNEWEGVWRVSFASTAERVAVLPAEFKQVVTVQPTIAPNVKVVSCKGPVAAGIIVSCPASMAMVGPPNAIGTYCIDRTRRNAPDFFAAKSACFNVDPQFGPAHLCDHNEWFTGCINGAFTDGFAGGAGESISDFDGVQWLTTAGSANCNSIFYRQITDPGPFRCCIK